MIDYTTNLNTDTAKGTFYASSRLVLLFGRYAGVLPLIGLSEKKSENTRLKFRSVYSLIYMLTYLALFISCALITSESIIGAKDKITVATLLKVMFNPTILTILCLILRICMMWERSIKAIENIEEKIPKYKRNNIRRINFLITFLLVFNQVEHLLYVLHKINGSVCDENRQSFLELLRTYLYAARPWLFDYIMPFNYTFSLAYEISSLQYAFLWVYVEMVAISFTLYLKQKFKQFNEILIYNVKSLKHPVGSLWIETKEYYTKLLCLYAIIDNLISPLVFISFANNLQKLCVKLLYVIEVASTLSTASFTATCETSKQTDWEHVAYVICTVAFIFTKILSLTIVGAHLHVVSREPLKLLHTLPSDYYDHDFQLFIDEVYHSQVEINGLKIFHVKQSSILKIVGAIITYELIMIQNKIFQNSST